MPKDKSKQTVVLKSLSDLQLNQLAIEKQEVLADMNQQLEEQAGQLSYSEYYEDRVVRAIHRGY